MTYLIGWALVALVAGGVVWLLRRAGAPGGENGQLPPARAGCCNAPPEVPPSPRASPQTRS